MVLWIFEVERFCQWLRADPVFVQKAGLDGHDVLAAVYGAEKLEGSTKLRDFLRTIAGGVFHGVV